MNEGGTRARACIRTQELAWIQDAKGNLQKTINRGRVRSYEKLVEASDKAPHVDRVMKGAIAIAPGPRLGNKVCASRPPARRRATYS